MSGVVLLAGAVLAAADFWEETEFTAWSDKDVEKMMADSPWAKRLTVRFPRPPQEARGGRGGGFRPGTSIPQTRLVVQWQSAQPIRQAMVRGRIGQGGTVDPQSQAFLDQSSPGYVVVVTGLPGQFGRLTPDALMAEARLERKGRAPIVPAQAQPQRAERGVSILYVFPKDEAIVLEDDEVEFITKIGDVTIKRKFKLEDMVFNDQLEL